MKNKILFVDFCETIVNKQTADDFCYSYLVYHGEKIRVKKVIKYIRGKFRLLGRLGGKKYVLSHLKGIHIQKIEEFADNYVKDLVKNINYEVLSIIQQHKAAGYKIVIVSGGYEVYLNIFAKKYGIDHVIGTRIEVKNDLVTGQFNGLDCMEQEKINRIVESGIDMDMIKSSTFISDHISDLPLFKLAKKRYLYKKGSALPTWAVQNDIKDYTHALAVAKNHL